VFKNQKNVLKLPNYSKHRSSITKNENPPV
ncbi:MAG: hypothetical protein ACI9XB_004383, partial [Gammaproteobacteria bacterium]